MVLRINMKRKGWKKYIYIPQTLNDNDHIINIAKGDVYVTNKPCPIRRADEYIVKQLFQTFKNLLSSKSISRPAGANVFSSHIQ